MVNLLLNFLFRRNISSETSGKLKKFLALANDIRRPSFKHFEQNKMCFKGGIPIAIRVRFAIVIRISGFIGFLKVTR